MEIRLNQQILEYQRQLRDQGRELQASESARFQAEMQVERLRTKLDDER